MIDIQKILETLPHRYPMLLVDRILEVSEDQTRCRGIKNVTINEPFFVGHYPGRPIMPGVLILECMAQVGASVLMMRPEYHDKVPLLGAVDDAKFKRPVTPGDQLVVDCEIVWTRGPVGKMRSSASVDGEPVASAEMTFMLRPKEG
ncbi:MAG TPA: 3-hydroxyacyl-ACP dehydratase FabZ [Fimbriimonas sp.]